MVHNSAQRDIDRLVWRHIMDRKMEQLSDFELAEKLFLAWQTTEYAEHDGEHTFKDLAGFSESYIEAWIRVAQTARHGIDALDEAEWRDGEPPKDGQKYEMRKVCSFGNGQHGWTAWLSAGWWDGRMFVRRNQMHGGTDALLGCTHWRPVPPTPP